MRKLNIAKKEFTKVYPNFFYFLKQKVILHYFVFLLALRLHIKYLKILNVRNCRYIFCPFIKLLFRCSLCQSGFAVAQLFSYCCSFVNSLFCCTVLNSLFCCTFRNSGMHCAVINPYKIKPYKTFIQEPFVTSSKPRKYVDCKNILNNDLLMNVVVFNPKHGE